MLYWLYIRVYKIQTYPGHISDVTPLHHAVLSHNEAAVTTLLALG